MPFLRYALPVLLVAGCAANSSVNRTVMTSVDKPGAYMIVMGKNYDAGALGDYNKALPPIYAQYGGRYVALTRDVVPLEGRDDYQAIVISVWDSADDAQDFWDSDEYRAAKKLREGNGEWDVVIVPALP